MKLKMVFVLFIVIMLSACAMESVEESEGKAEEPERFTYEKKNLNITKDLETGCKYIIFNDPIVGSGGITPLLKSDGSVDCED